MRGRVRLGRLGSAGGAGRRTLLVLGSGAVGLATSQAVPPRREKPTEAPLDGERLKRMAQTLGLGLGTAVVVGGVAGQAWARLRRPAVPALGLLVIPNAFCFWRDRYLPQPHENQGLTDTETLEKVPGFLMAVTFVTNGLGLGLLWQGLGRGVGAAVGKGAVAATALTAGTVWTTLAVAPEDWEPSLDAEMAVGALAMAALLMALLRERVRIGKQAIRGTDYKQILFEPAPGCGLEWALPRAREAAFNGLTNGALLAGSLGGLAYGTGLLRAQLREREPLPPPPQAPRRPRLAELDDLQLPVETEAEGLELLWTPALLLFVALTELFIATI